MLPEPPLHSQTGLNLSATQPQPAHDLGPLPTSLRVGKGHQVYIGLEINEFDNTTNGVGSGDDCCFEEGAARQMQTLPLDSASVRRGRCQEDGAVENTQVRHRAGSGSAKVASEHSVIKAIKR